MVLIECFDEGKKVDCDAYDHSDMEQLVRVTPDVESTRFCALRPSSLQRQDISDKSSL